MRTTSKKKQQQKTVQKPEIIYDPNMPDFSQSPFVLEKAERARAFIAKYGLPEDQEKKQKK